MQGVHRLVEALLKVLVAMRDAGHILLSNTIRNYFSLDRLEAMAVDKTFIRDGQYAIGTEFLPDGHAANDNYLATLQLYQRKKRPSSILYLSSMVILPRS